MGEIIYEVDLRRLLVTIDFPDLTDTNSGNLLCRRHADSLIAPKGWTIINNREEVQRLFSAPVTQESVKVNSQNKLRPYKTANSKNLVEETATANLFDVAVISADADADADAASDFGSVIGSDLVSDFTTDVTADVSAELAQLLDTQETQGLPWTPQFDRTSDLDGKLRARGRLLGRAFGHRDSSGDHESHQDFDHDQSHSES